jgi:hypothetical protein
MEISGHKTRAIFDRYTIVNDRRMKQNIQKLEEHLKTKETASSGEDDRGRIEVFWNHGEPGGARTRDHRIKSAMLYQLSYRPILLTTS